MLIVSAFVFITSVTVQVVRGLDPYECVQWGDTNCCRLYETESLTENAPHTSVIKDSLWKCQDVCWGIPCGALLYYKHIQSCTFIKDKYDKNNPPKCWAKWIPINGLNVVPLENQPDLLPDLEIVETPLPNRKENSYSRALNFDRENVQNNNPQTMSKELLYMSDGILEEPNFKEATEYFLPARDLVIYPNNLIQIVTENNENENLGTEFLEQNTTLAQSPEKETFIPFSTVEQRTVTNNNATTIQGSVHVSNVLEQAEIVSSLNVTQPTNDLTLPPDQLGNKFVGRSASYGRAIRIDQPAHVVETRINDLIAPRDCEIDGVKVQGVICRNIPDTEWDPVYLLWGAVGIACCVMLVVILIAVKIFRGRNNKQKEVIPERIHDYQDDSSSYGPEELDVDLALQV